MASISNEKLKQILLEGGFVDEKKLKAVDHIIEVSGASLESIITDKEILPDEHLGQIIATEIGVPFMNLRTQAISDELLKLLPESFARENNVVAYAQDEKGLHIAMNDPRNAHLIQIIEKKAKVPLVLHYSTLVDLHQVLSLYKQDLDKEIMKLVENTMNKGKVRKDNDEDTEVIQMVDLLVEYAYSSKASDIHIEPQDVDTVIRFRVDGVLSDKLFLPKELHDRLVTRLKILGHLRTDEHFSAQDGHVKSSFAGEQVDIRMSVLPTTFGEKVVLRLLSEKSRQYSLEELGFADRDFEKLHKQIKKPWGMILVTGPTGSGKTTSLYAMMKILNQREVNISTIEDPVEYSLSGVNQIQVNKKTELTFSAGLRSIVRQDPDIIMVGEIRDTETADISINAALTGHLLLSTLHTNDAATALPRLLDMGVEPFLVASTVNMVMAQRLVRHICPKCIGSVEVTIEELEEKGYVVPDKLKELMFVDGKASLYKGKGCNVCHLSGYLGRVGVFEILEIDSEIRKMILQQVSSDVVRDYAIQNGMTTMFDDAVDKVRQGLTTLEEILRVVRE